MKKEKIKLKLDVIKIVKENSRGIFDIPTTKSFKDKKKYNRKKKHKGDYHD